MIIRLIKRFRFIMAYSAEIDELLKEQLDERRRAKENAEREERRHMLNLCYKHRQEPNHSHFAEHNCDYCKALAKLGLTDKPI